MEEWRAWIEDIICIVVFPGPIKTIKDRNLLSSYVYAWPLKDYFPISIFLFGQAKTLNSWNPIIPFIIYMPGSTMKRNSLYCQAKTRLKIFLLYRGGPLTKTRILSGPLILGFHPFSILFQIPPGIDLLRVRTRQKIKKRIREESR